MPSCAFRDARGPSHGSRVGAACSACEARCYVRRAKENDLPAVEVTRLAKRYGTLEAVRGIDFSVETGEVFAMLGPNGAGKTSTLEVLEGFSRRSGGDVRVLGADPEHAGREWRERVGIVLQGAVIEPYLKVREVLQRNAGYYPTPRAVDDVLDLVGLADKADARVKTLSGGLQRRLDVGLGIIGAPELLFLDEPTTGFDPSARPRRVGARREAQGRRHHDHLDDALHGRGSASRRPRRGDQPRGDRRCRHARDDRGPGKGSGASAVRAWRPESNRPRSASLSPAMGRARSRWRRPMRSARCTR